MRSDETLEGGVGRTMKRSLTWFGVGLVTSALFLSAPAIAERIADFARDSDKVDGYHAVGFGVKDRGGKLVATNEDGRLPNGIVERVPRAGNASRLGGIHASNYARSCAGIQASVYVLPDDLTAEYQNRFGFSCGGNRRNEVKRIAVGTYRVRFFGYNLTGCDFSSDLPFLFSRVSATVEGSEPVIATYESVEEQNSEQCTGNLTDNYSVPIDVHLFTPDGEPVDRPVTVTLLGGPQSGS
jgi:hypothetical protein